MGGRLEGVSPVALSAVRVVKTMLLVMGLFPWLDHRVAMPMDQMARVYSRYPDVDVYYLDPNWPSAPSARWRQWAEGTPAAYCWRLGPLSAASGAMTAAADGPRSVFVDIEGHAVLVEAFLAALDAADRVVCLAHAFWPELCRRVVETLLPDAVIYDCHETVVTMSGGPTRAAHEWLVARADVVLAISPAVAQAVERLGRTPMQLGNGIEVERFAAEPPARPQWTFGFLGSFYDWVDVSALHALAEAFPDETLALVGPVHESMGRAYERLTARRNVNAHPGVPHAEVPAILQRMELCLLPRRLTPDSLACDPLKLYEYLAAGRPVVSTRLPVAEALDDVVYLADSGAGFVEAAARALADVRTGRFDADRAAGCRAAVATRTWEARCRAAWSAIAG